MKKVMHANLSAQRGVTKLGLLMFGLYIAIFLTVGLKVTQIYADNNFVAGICCELIESGEASALTQRETRERVSNGLRVNHVADFDLTSTRKRKVSNNSYCLRNSRAANRKPGHGCGIRYHVVII
jgi:hypothetical protein|tara:strand:+ start:218 stop:592 length:375 start_codon:yes stop_codon:yes gene_type:complete